MVVLNPGRTPENVVRRIRCYNTLVDMIELDMPISPPVDDVTIQAMQSGCVLDTNEQSAEARNEKAGYRQTLKISQVFGLGDRFIVGFRCRVDLC